jgi:hypothetical protein
MDKPELSNTVKVLREIHVGRAIATAWLALWTAAGFLLGAVVYVIHLAIWAVGYTMGWSFHAANYGFRKGAQIKTVPKRKPSMPVPGED